MNGNLLPYKTATSGSDHGEILREHEVKNFWRQVVEGNEAVLDLVLGRTLVHVLEVVNLQVLQTPCHHVLVLLGGFLKRQSQVVKV